MVDLKRRLDPVHVTQIRPYFFDLALRPASRKTSPAARRSSNVSRTVLPLFLSVISIASGPTALTVRLGRDRSPAAKNSYGKSRLAPASASDPSSAPSPCGLLTQPLVPLVNDDSLPKGASTSCRNKVGASQRFVCFRFNPPMLGSIFTANVSVTSFTAASLSAPPTACCAFCKSCFARLERSTRRPSAALSWARESSDRSASTLPERR